MAFKVKHFIKCDTCGVSSECIPISDDASRKRAANNLGWVRYKKMQFCDLTCKKMYIDHCKSNN